MLKRTRIGSVLMAAALAMTSCSLIDGDGATVTDGGGEGGLTSDTVAPDGEDDGDSTGEPSADVDKSTVVQDAGPASMDPLPADDSGAAVLALTEDVHGPTDDVSGEMNRLVPFPPLPTPKGAHITELRVEPRTGIGDAPTTYLNADVSFVADGSRDELVTFYEAQVVQNGWDKTGTENDVRAGDEPFTELTFEQPDPSGGPAANLKITLVEDGSLPKTLIEITYNNSAYPDPDLVTRFAAWAGDVPLPAGGNYRSTTVSTRFGPGRTDYEVTSRYEYDDGTGEEDREQQIKDAAEAAGFEYVEPEFGGGIELPSDTYDKFAIRNFTADTVNTTAQVKFLTPGFDGVTVASVAQSTEPLPAFASAAEIETVINEIHGPTTDVTGQMQRLGPFPDVPTPLGADVIELTSRVGNIIGTDAQKAVIGVVEMWVDGEFEDVVAYYETNFAGLGWTQTGSNEETEDGGQTKIVKLDYDIPGVDAGVGNAFELTVTDDVDDAKTRVELDYTEFVPTAEANLDRWLGWQGEAPVPAGETVEGAGVSTDGLFGSAIFYLTEYNYPDVTEAELTAKVEAAMAGSDYAIDPEDDSEIRMELTHPFFAAASVSFLDFGDRTRLSLQASRPLAE